MYGQIRTSGNTGAPMQLAWASHDLIQLGSHGRLRGLWLAVRMSQSGGNPEESAFFRACVPRGYPCVLLAGRSLPWLLGDERAFPSGINGSLFAVGSEIRMRQWSPFLVTKVTCIIDTQNFEHFFKTFVLFSTRIVHSMKHSTKYCPLVTFMTLFNFSHYSRKLRKEKGTSVIVDASSNFY